MKITSTQPLARSTPSDCFRRRPCRALTDTIKHSLLTWITLSLAACASTSNPPGPEGTGDHKTGYDLGRSDAVKQQYWLVQNLQKEPKTPAAKVTDLPITVPGQTQNGVTTLSHTETVRIEEQ